MAVSDDDWKKFLDSTEEDPDEVETDPEEDLEDEPQDDPEEDPKADPKKSKEDEEENPDDPEEDSEEEDDPEEDDPEDDPKKSKTDSDYQPRLKQFIKDDGTYDLETAEKSYIESGKQAVKLDNDLKQVRSDYGELLGAIKANPEIAEKLFGKEGAKQLIENDAIPNGGNPSGNGGGGDPVANHPLLRHLEAQQQNASRKEYEDFVEAHPEAVTDPEKARKIGVFLKQHGAVYREENNGEIPSMKDSLEAAYRYYGWDLEIKKKEDVATAAKKTAATRRTPSAKRAATKKETNMGEQFFANKLGVKLKS